MKQQFVVSEFEIPGAEGREIIRPAAVNDMARQLIAFRAQLIHHQHTARCCDRLGCMIDGTGKSVVIDDVVENVEYRNNIERLVDQEAVAIGLSHIAIYELVRRKLFGQVLHCRRRNIDAHIISHTPR